MSSKISLLSQRIQSRGLFRINPGLSRLQRVLRALGDPQNKLRAIHIAGTNGKGSVAASLDAVFRAHGYQTGFYFSPHLSDVRERIQVNGTWISTAAFDRCAARVIRAERQTRLQLTYFEILTAIAFLYFVQKKTEIVILECGLGGRWDATNVIPKNEAAVITNIDLDHTEWLGKRIQDIAREKAGIIKSGSFVVTAADEPALSILQSVADKERVPCFAMGRVFRGRSLSMDPFSKTHEMEYRSHEKAKRVTLSLLGKHQADNAAIVLHTCERLASRWSLRPDLVRKALRNVQWPGRLELIRRNTSEPMILLDGAHNPAGARRLAQFLSSSPFTGPNCVIFGAYRDKQISEMLPALERLASPLILTELGGERGAVVSGYRSFLKSPAMVRLDPVEALNTAIAVTPSSGLVIVCGSLSLVGRLRPFALTEVASRRDNQALTLNK